MPVRIELLADRSELIPPLANLHYQEWGPLRPGETLEQRTERLGSVCGRNGVPLALVATDDDVLVGSALLVAKDMEGRPELTPWVAGIFVLPKYRHRGIASALIEEVTTRAKAVGVPTVYLYTLHTESLYARLGWVPIEYCDYRGVPVVIMSKDIAA